MNSAENVSVKPLEWSEIEQARSVEDPTTEPTGDYEAMTPFGPYYIEMYFGSDSYGWAATFDGEPVAGGDRDCPDKAKAAAQADYEQRVLSCLRSPPTEDGDRVEVVAWVGDYRKSDGTYDYFVMLGHGERQMSLHCHRIRGRAEYEAAEINHSLTGSPKPEFEDFDLDGPASPRPETVGVSEAMELCQQIINEPQGSLWNYGTTPSARDKAEWKGRRDAAQEILTALSKDTPDV